jgi:hypothetical protein
MVSETEATAREVSVTHIDGEAAVDRTRHVGIVIEEVLKRMPILIIVGNGGWQSRSERHGSTVHQVKTRAEKGSRRGKRTTCSSSYRKFAPSSWRCSAPASAHVNNTMGMVPATLPRVEVRHDGFDMVYS